MFQSLRRGAPRIAFLFALGATLMLLQGAFPILLGPIFTPMILGLSITLFGLAAGEVAVRIVQPSINAQAVAHVAIQTQSVPAALVYIGRNILVATILIIVASASRAATAPPANALALLPVVKAEQMAYWPDMPLPSMFGAQIHKETCITERHPKCWTPYAELKTSREQGLGLGQFTRSFKADGSTRFDALAEIVQAYPKELAGLSWASPYDPRLQIRSVILKDRQIYNRIQGAATPIDRLKMTAAAYNGGEGGLRSDRASCRGTPGCNDGIWDGHVALTSLKQKTAIPGYGKPFFVINREYAATLVNAQPLRVRYVPYLDKAV